MKIRTLILIAAIALMATPHISSAQEAEEVEVDDSMTTQPDATLLAAQVVTDLTVDLYRLKDEGLSIHDDLVASSQSCSDLVDSLQTARDTETGAIAALVEMEGTWTAQNGVFRDVILVRQGELRKELEAATEALQELEDKIEPMVIEHEAIIVRGNNSNEEMRATWRQYVDARRLLDFMRGHRARFSEQEPYEKQMIDAARLATGKTLERRLQLCAGDKDALTPPNYDFLP